MGVYKNNQGSLDRIAGGTFYADNPIGTILAFGGSNIPTGWHLCDGTALSRTTYKDLFNVIGTNFGVGDGSTTFNLPDLSGEFLRGAGTNSHSGQGNGANVGVHQDATNHLLIVGKNSIGIQCGIDTEASDLQTNYDSQSATGAGKYFANPTSAMSQRPQTFTSRPTNTSVNYIIKMYNTPLPLDLQNEVREVYSTEERVIGQWIDGKPIYRKVFEVTSPSTSGTSVTIVTGALANAYMVGVRCVLHRSNPKGDFEAGSVNETTEYIKVWAKDDDIRMKVSADFVSCPASIILEYTKTTD